MFRAKQPAQVRVDETVDRAVRVARLIGKRVMLQVIGGPANRQRPRPPSSRSARSTKRTAGWASKAAMRQHAVEAGRYSQGNRDVQTDQQREVPPRNCSIPQLSDGNACSHERGEDDEQDHRFVQS